MMTAVYAGSHQSGTIWFNSILNYSLIHRRFPYPYYITSNHITLAGTRHSKRVPVQIHFSLFSL